MAPTSDQLLNLSGVRRRVDSYRFDVLDAGLNKLGSIAPERDAPPTLTMDTTRSVMRSMSNFSVDAARQAGVDTLNDRIQPWMILQNGAEYPLGVLLFADTPRQQRSWGLELDAALLDLGFILDQQIGRTYGANVGSNIIGEALFLAQEVIHTPIIATASPATLSAAIGARPSDVRGTLIAKLLALAGYLPPYFDNDGALIFRPVPSAPFSDTVPAYEAGGRIIKDSIVVSDGILRAPNRYIVVDTSTNDSPIAATYDIPASAPNSIASGRFPIVKTIEVQGVSDPSAAYLAAQAAANTDPDQYLQTTFASTHDPRHSSFDIVTLLGEQSREIGWSSQLVAGAKMTHSLRRLYV